MLTTNTIDHEKKSIESALGLTKERGREITSKLEEIMNERNPHNNSGMIEIIIEVCDTPEELAYFVFRLGQEDVCHSCPLEELHGHSSKEF